jgi:plasmid stability protein
MHALQTPSGALHSPFMASLTILNLDDPLKARLRSQAATHGHSMEEEARVIPRAALSREAPAPRNLYDAIRARVAESGGFELELPPREPMRDLPNFD